MFERVIGEPMQVGFFGKLPAYGDFVQRNVSPGIIDYLDNWILQAMDSTKSVLAEQWRERFFNSPIWRFHFQSGIISEDTFSGIMMPSVDAAGRCYPFLVICRFEAQSDIFSISSMIDDCHAKCEEFLLKLLVESNPNLDGVNTTLSTFYTSIEKAHIPVMPSKEDLTHNELFRCENIQTNKHSNINQHFLAYLVENYCSPVSVWNRAASENVSAQYRFYKGMPSIQAYTSLLTV